MLLLFLIFIGNFMIISIIIFLFTFVQQRKKTILEKSNALAESVNGCIVMKMDLLDEVIHEFHTIPLRCLCIYFIAKTLHSQCLGCKSR